MSGGFFSSVPNRRFAGVIEEFVPFPCESANSVVAKGAIRFDQFTLYGEGDVFVKFLRRNVGELARKVGNFDYKIILAVAVCLGEQQYFPY